MSTPIGVHSTPSNAVAGASTMPIFDESIGDMLDAAAAQILRSMRSTDRGKGTAIERPSVPAKLPVRRTVHGFTVAGPSTVSSDSTDQVVPVWDNSSGYSSGGISLPEQAVYRKLERDWWLPQRVPNPWLLIARAADGFLLLTFNATRIGGCHSVWPAPTRRMHTVWSGWRVVGRSFTVFATQFLYPNTSYSNLAGPVLDGWIW